MGEGHPQVQSTDKLLQSEGSQCWRVVDFFSALENARYNICEMIGTQYPLLIDRTDLNEFFEHRIQQGASLAEIDIEASLLKIIFQWGAIRQPHKANKVQYAYEELSRSNKSLTSVQTEPYENNLIKKNYEHEELYTVDKNSIENHIQALASEGLSQRQIAKTLNISQSSVFRALKKAEASMIQSDS